MKNKIKVWLIIGTSLLVAGLLMFAAVMTVNGWDFRKLGTIEYETETHNITEPFSEITINTDTADIEFLESEDGSCEVVCYEEQDAKHSVYVKDNTLNITLQNYDNWYEHIGINFGSPKVTVYLPKGEYVTLKIEGDTSDVKIPKNFTFVDVDILVSTGDVEYYASTARDIWISTSTGDITLENIKAETLQLRVTTGETYLTNVNCKYIQSLGNTGDITLKNTVAEEQLLIRRSTGDVQLQRSDSAQIYIETDTGDVTGTVLEGRNFVANSDTGKVRVPQGINFGNCDITTNTGDILIDIAK